MLCDFSNVILKNNAINSARTLCENILSDTGFAMLPGSNFGIEDEKLITRIAFVDFDGQAIINRVEEEGEQIIDQDDFVQKYAPKVFDGMQKLKEWANVKVLIK